MSSIESARHELAEVVNTLAFSLDSGAETSLCLLEARRCATSDKRPAVLVPKQEHDLLLDMAREAEAELKRSAQDTRIESARSGASDPVADAITTEKAFAVIFAAIAEGGSAARAGDRGTLAARFSPGMLGFIEREIA